MTSQQYEEYRGFKRKKVCQILQGKSTLPDRATR